MTYDELRSIAKDGDVIFLTVNKKDYLSRLTSWFTKSPYTHAAFVFWFKDRLMLIESTTHGGSRISFASVYSDRNVDLISSPKPWSEIEEKALVRSGTADYGWFSAAYIGIREFCFTHFGWKLPPNKDNRNKACSEFVAEVLDFEDADVSPGKLYKILSEKADMT